MLVAGTAPIVARAASPVCPNGRFFVEAPTTGRSMAFAAIDLASDRVSLDVTCGPGIVHVVHRRHATIVRARWSFCGSAHDMRLRARVTWPGCGELRGTMSMRGAHQRFVARRSLCGDG